MKENEKKNKDENKRLDEKMEKLFGDILKKYIPREVKVQELTEYQPYLTSEDRKSMHRGRSELQDAVNSLIGALERYPQLNALSEEYSSEQLKHLLDLWLRLQPALQLMQESTQALSDIAIQVEHDLCTTMSKAYSVMQGLERAKPGLLTSAPALVEYMKRSGRRRKKEENKKEKDTDY